VFHDAKNVRMAIPLNDINHEVPMPSKEIGSNGPILILREGSDGSLNLRSSSVFISSVLFTIEV
jgi:hypothetical protein